ncbi:hypothetical protein U9M48_041073 [Paspalum notatum var. saurae]|uniref:BED-type domain-containing protein n=1 Tax=Paspalum notatum var. saurae TaxID=547442 RepID=A0AAQ3UPR2_PASNO
MANEGNTQQQRNRTKQRRLEPRSEVWKDFTRATGDDGKEIAECNRCGKQYKYHGTKNQLEHLEKCSGKEPATAACAAPPPQHNAPSGSGSVKDSNPGLDQRAANDALARVIAFGGCDPAILEDRSFRLFAMCLNPKYELPSRRVIEEICDTHCGSMREEAHAVMEECSTGNFSLSVGKVKIMEEEVLYIQWHFIDIAKWLGDPVLDRRVMDAYVVTPLGGYCISPLSGVPEASLELVRKGIVSAIPAGRGRLFMMACADDDAFVNELKHAIQQVNRSPTGREPFCATYMDHVIHSIARCLVPNSDFTRRMFSVVNNLKLTRQRRQDLLSQHGLDDPRECNEQWYSCYSTFEVLRKGYSSTIAGTDFQVIRILCDVWGKLYRAIKTISHRSRSPTSHLCLIELFTLREALQTKLESATGDIVDGLRRAKDALDKAIQDSYVVWSIPLAMDPRYKLESVEVILITIFGSEAAGAYIANVKGQIRDLYTSYCAKDDHAIDTDIGSKNPLKRALHDHRRKQGKTDLDQYLEQAPVVPETESIFDIGYWWSYTGWDQYPMVTQMALDALAMPTCSRLDSEGIAKVKSIIRGYYSIDDEEGEDDDGDEAAAAEGGESDTDDMIQEPI